MGRQHLKSKQQNIAEIASTQQSKRRFLQGLAVVLGSGAVAQLTSGNALASALSYQAKPDSAEKIGKLFSHAQMKLLAEICNVVLPETDTPSAKALDVHGFIDHQLLVCYGKKEQEQGKVILNNIDQQSQQHFSKHFIQLSFDEQTQLITAIEKRNLGFTNKDRNIFKGLKSLIVFGFFTSEVGATQALSYQAVPGGFKGSIPYDSVGKSYGSLAYY